jgi:hypothetical protein
VKKPVPVEGIALGTAGSPFLKGATLGRSKKEADANQKSVRA